jgi:catechol 2,3-dioxygenase-like lactoylglutathione lyase family enzyme
MAKNLTNIAPHFLVADLRRAAEYYRDKLGFEILPYFGEPPVFTMVKREGLLIQLALMEAGRGGSNRKWREEGIDAYLWVNDVAALHGEFMATQADVIEAPTGRIYGMKEMTVRDLDGYVLVFGQDIPGSA